MPDPERLLVTLRRALHAFRSTPGRVGRFVYLRDAAEVLVVGDLHGHLPNFQAAWQLADLARNPSRHLIVQELIHSPFLYGDGSDKSHQLVDLTAMMKCQFPRQVHFLLGNHELAQMTGRRILKGEREHNDTFLAGVRHAYGKHADAIYGLYMELFAAIPLAARTPNRVFFSHSLPAEPRLATFDPSALEKDESEPADLVPGGTAHSLVWGRDTSAGHVSAFLRRVDADWLVTGHITCDETGFDLPNDRQLIVDCQGHPAACALLAADRPLSPGDLRASVRLLKPSGAST